jgi:hypothetical protein
MRPVSHGRRRAALTTTSSMPRLRNEGNLARFEQRFEIGEDARSTSGHGRDELGIGLLDFVGGPWAGNAMAAKKQSESR